MGNWLKSIKTSPRHAGKHEFTVNSTLKNTELMEEKKTKAGNRFYRMHIAICDGCKKKFKMNKNMLKVYITKGWDKHCPLCRGDKAKLYLMISKKDEKAIKNKYKAQGCKVRKMTKAEKNKFK